MKIDIIIKDATKEEAADLLSFLNGSKEKSTVVVNTKDIPVNPVIENTVNNVVAQSTPVTTATDNSEVDASGLPWDSRIHSSNKGKTAKGVWNRRRGVDDATVQTVENELRGVTLQNFPPVNQAPVQQFQQQIPPQNLQPYQQVIPVQHFQQPQQFQPVQQFQQPQQFQPVNQAPIQQFQQQTPPPVQQFNAPQQPQVMSFDLDFQKFMKIIGNLFATQEIAPNYIDTLLQKINIQFGKSMMAITDIAASPDMIKFAYDCLIADGKKVD